MDKLLNIRINKVGGLTFIRIGRLSVSFCVTKPKPAVWMMPGMYIPGVSGKGRDAEIQYWTAIRLERELLR